jgi:cytochrome c peroxidase
VPEIEPLRFAFKTPTLRNIRERAPYMHNGSEATLDAVVALYDRGGRVRRPSISPELRPLGLTAGERRDLVAFLESLSSPEPAVAPPALPR